MSSRPITRTLRGSATCLHRPLPSTDDATAALVFGNRLITAEHSECVSCRLKAASCSDNLPVAVVDARIV